MIICRRVESESYGCICCLNVLGSWGFLRDGKGKNVAYITKVRPSIYIFCSVLEPILQTSLNTMSYNVGGTSGGCKHNFKWTLKSVIHP